RSRQRSVAGSYSSLRGTALPATPPPSAKSLSPTAAAATSPRTAGIGAFCVHVPGGVCDCAARPRSLERNQVAVVAVRPAPHLQTQIREHDGLLMRDAEHVKILDRGQLAVAIHPLPP